SYNGRRRADSIDCHSELRCGPTPPVREKAKRETAWAGRIHRVEWRRLPIRERAYQRRRRLSEVNRLPRIVEQDDSRLHFHNFRLEETPRGSVNRNSKLKCAFDL